MKNFIGRINQLTVDYSHEPIPENEKRHSWRLFGIWIVTTINLAYLSFGIALSQSVAPEIMIPAALVGNFILAGSFCLSAWIGSKTGLPIGALLPHSMGKYPAYAVLCMVGLSLAGWFGFQLELFTKATVQVVFGAVDNPALNFAITVLGGLLMMTSAVIGFKAVDRLSQIGMPVLFILMLWPVIQFFMDGHQFSDLTFPAGDKNSLTFGAAASLFVAGSALGMLTAPDVSRYTRSPAGAVVATGSAVFIGGSAIFICALLLGYLGLASDLAGVLIAFHMGFLGLILLFLATWTTSDTNIYMSSLAFAAIFKSVRKWKIALMIGFLGICVAQFGIVARFLEYVGLMGLFFPPAAAIFVIDYFTNPSKYARIVYGAGAPVPNIRVEALIAFLFGMGVNYSTESADTIGAGLISLTTIPAVDGFLASACLYSVLIFLRTKLFRN